VESNYARLKERHRRERDAWPAAHSLRVHRSLSWLRAAESRRADPDGRFIFLWIAFNAAYSVPIDEDGRFSERGAFRTFLGRLLERDPQGRIAALVWQEFGASIRGLLENRYVFQDYWDFQNGLTSEEEWKRRFLNANRAAKRALAAQQTGAVLAIVLSRIYTLRNQLVHGGATWGGGTNREQLRDCLRFMEHLVPLVIDVLMDAPNAVWGPVAFPVVD
jgi:Apea-like HEPN